MYWGCHPELLGIEPHRDSGTVSFIYPGGFMSKRKPFEAVIEAFSCSPDPRSRLTFKAQVERRVRKVADLAGRDSRIEVIWDDLPTRRYLQLFADSDVCLAPSRWEGLGLHLYEATAFGMPIVTNDNPPMNELVEDGVNGLLIRGIETGRRSPGSRRSSPTWRSWRGAITRLADDELRAELARGAADAGAVELGSDPARVRRADRERYDVLERGRSADGSLTETTWRSGRSRRRRTSSTSSFSPAPVTKITSCAGYDARVSSTA